jgi:Mlc titration factor MtfA (ptsG expression regulator)
VFGFRERRRRRLRAMPLSEAAWRTIDARVPYVKALGEADRAELGGTIQVLLAEKRFEGCGGLAITDEVRLVIAAQAAVLLLHRETDYYPKLRSVLVYPSTYAAPTTTVQPDGTVVEGTQARLGESWHGGALVLSWSDVVAGAADPRDGRNVVLHEFAHRLDGEGGPMDGAPTLGDRAHYRAWARVLGDEYAELTRDLHDGHASLIDAYGATNPPEFFAVVTETFFERPAALKKKHPELYAALAGFNRQDPAARTATG